jgi:hypothetical protein
MAMQAPPPPSRAIAVHDLTGGGGGGGGQRRAGRAGRGAVVAGILFLAAAMADEQWSSLWNLMHPEKSHPCHHDIEAHIDRYSKSSSHYCGC